MRSVHFSYYNFYNEYPYAQRISKLLENLTSIPKAAERTFIKIISICYVGNGKGYKDGVDEIAVSYYEKFIRKFTDKKLSLIHKDSDFKSLIKS